MRTILSLVLFFGSLVSQVAFAGGGGGGGASSIVFDPTNFAKNTVTSGQSIVAEAQRIRQIYNQLQQYRQALLANQSMDPQVVAGLLTTTNSNLGGMQQYASVLNTMLNDNEQLRRLAITRAMDYSQSGLSPQDYAQRERDRINAGDQQRQALYSQEQAVLNRANQDAQSVQDTQARIANTVGVTESTNLMNTQLNQMRAQNMELMNWQVARAAVQDQQEIIKKQNDDDLQNQLSADDARSKAMIKNFQNSTSRRN